MLIGICIYDPCNFDFWGKYSAADRNRFSKRLCREWLRLCNIYMSQNISQHRKSLRMQNINFRTFHIVPCMASRDLHKIDYPKLSRQVPDVRLM